LVGRLGTIITRFIVLPQEPPVLVNFFSPDEIADRVIEALEDGRSFASLRQNARQTITDRFDLRSICLPAHLRLLNMLVPREQRASVTAARVACGQ
jgi:hypothetical protein